MLCNAQTCKCVILKYNIYQSSRNEDAMESLNHSFENRKGLGYWLFHTLRICITLHHQSSNITCMSGDGRGCNIMRDGFVLNNTCQALLGDPTHNGDQVEEIKKKTVEKPQNVR